MRFAYADPPYPGRAARYYRHEPTFAGEVDHVALIASLQASGYDGWALSTAADALRELLPLCPPEARVWSRTPPRSLRPLTTGDELVDLYPGTGVVGRAWAELTS